jgi:biotin carboxyl carrier protein
MNSEATSDSFRTFIVDGDKYKTRLSKKYMLRKPYVPHDPRKINAFIPGTIKKIFVKEGDKIEKGEKLLILEAMKMNNTLLAPLAGVIREICVKSGQVVTKNQLLIELE